MVVGISCMDESKEKDFLGSNKTDPGLLFVLRELDRKANEKWVSSEVQMIKTKSQELQVLITEVRKRTEFPHRCLMEEDVKDLRSWRTQMSSFKIVVVLALVMALLGGASYVFILDGTVTNSRENIFEIKEALRELRSDYVEFKDEIRLAIDSKESSRVREYQELKRLIEEYSSFRKGKSR